MSNQPILVTGGGGFLGRYIVEKLVERGYSVRSFSRKSYSELEELGVQQLQGDLRDAHALRKACEGVSTVHHTAAVAGIWGSWETFHGINTLGTENVIEACRSCGVDKLVYTSSPSVTFDGDDQCDVDESAPYPASWLCHYPHTKALGEQAVLNANDDSLRTCALRPHLIWGPRDAHLIPRLLDRARSGKLRQVGDGTNLVDTVYVANAADAHLNAADSLETGSASCGKAYFISQGEPVNCWDWINQILQLASLSPIKKSISFNAAYRVGGVLEFVWQTLRQQSEPRMTRFLAAQLAKSHYFRIDRAREDFGYQPSISMEEGMRRLGEELRVR